MELFEYMERELEIRILLVACGEEIRAGLANAPTLSGVRVEAARTLPELFSLVEESEYALIIADMTALPAEPRKAGEVVAALEEKSQAPLVLMGEAAGDAAEVMAALAAGISDYWLRPLPAGLAAARAKVHIDHFSFQKRFQLKNEALATENEALRSSAEKLAALAKFAEENRQPVLLIGEDRGIDYRNGAAQALMEAWGEKKCSEFRMTWRARHEECRIDGDCADFEFAAGGENYIFTMLPISNTGTTYLLGENITQRRHAEKSLVLASSVFDNTIEGISITDRHGKIQKVNPAFTRITGYQPEEVIGQNPRILKSDRHDAEFYRNMWNGLGNTGEWQGEIWNRRKSGEAYPEWLSINVAKDPEGEILHYIAVFHDISEIKDSEDKLKYHANFDVLTGLPNRMLFVDRLERSIAYARRNEQMLAILFLDIDNFQHINDSFGHHMGDRFLQGVAKRLSAICRQEDTIARLGSDEFIYILPRKTDEIDAASAARRITKAFEAPIELSGHELFVSISIGITIYPGDGETVEALMKNADMAMHRAKDLGKNNFVLYTNSMNVKVQRRLELERGLRKALENDEFEVRYQPKVETKTGKVTGMEALIRWHREKKEYVSPMEFIPLAEDTGMIFAVGEWILKEACLQIGRWHAAGHPELSVAVNLSARQFQDENLVAVIGQALEETGLDPSFLNLEITENMVMSNVEAAIRAMESLSAMGISISIDDFGTGYSSLSYLKKFPVDVLKIDRSFVMDIPDNGEDVAIARAVLSLAKSMNLKVVAEGVETAPQLEFMRDHGCEEVQGYFISKPIDAPGMTEFLLRTDGFFRVEGEKE